MRTHLQNKTDKLQNQMAPHKAISPYQRLVNKLEILVKEVEGEQCATLPGDIPKRWEKHGDLILLPEMAFQDDRWRQYGDQLWNTICEVLSVKRVARKHRISANGFRSPQVELLKGNDGWVVHKDNGILYTYDITKCMFSSGNITEKLRVAQFNCEDEIVVDLFAGIGYFTLPYLKYGGAKLVHACEWNPDAIEALKRNLELNGVDDRCVIHFGDCQQVSPVGIADRVNLGLLPSSEKGWRPAAQALNPSKGGILHVHGNITTKDIKSHPTVINSGVAASVKDLCKMTWTNWADEVADSLRSILHDIHQKWWTVTVKHVEHVKSYAPHIDHIVADIECRPC